MKDTNHIHTAKCQHQNHKNKCYGENIYNKVDNEKRLNLLKLVKEEGKSLKEAAKSLNINYSTAKTILRVYRIENRILKKSPYQKRMRRNHKNNIFNFQSNSINNSNHSDSLSSNGSHVNIESENHTINNTNKIEPNSLEKHLNISELNPHSGFTKENFLNLSAIFKKEKKIFKEKKNSEILNDKNAMSNLANLLNPTENMTNLNNNTPLTSKTNSNSNIVSLNPPHQIKNLQNYQINPFNYSNENQNLPFLNRFEAQNSLNYAGMNQPNSYGCFVYPQISKTTEEFMENFYSVVNMLRNCIGEIINNEYTIRSLSHIIKYLGNNGQNLNMINFDFGEIKQTNYSDTFNKQNNK